jgi:hypothetical protein
MSVVKLSEYFCVNYGFDLKQRINLYQTLISVFRIVSS